jgi:hypothetical protein
MCFILFLFVFYRVQVSMFFRQWSNIFLADQDERQRCLFADQKQFPANHWSLIGRYFEPWKDDHQYKDNYCPISLLPSISKISEKIVFAQLYEFLLEIHFLSDFQSGFRPGNSTVNQQIYIVHVIYQALDMGKEVCMVFLDFTKEFDQLWHKSLLHKMQTLGLKDPLLSWFRSYLTDWKQRVVIDGQTLSWLNTEAGVPQGSVLGPLVFLIYINEIGVDIVSNCFLYTDDTSLFDITDDPISSASKLNLDLDKISQWCKYVKMWKYYIFKKTFLDKHHPTLHLDGNTLREVNSHIHLGLKLTSNFTWNHHIQSIHKKASKMTNLLKSVKYKLHRSTLISLCWGALNTIVWRYLELIVFIIILMTFIFWTRKRGLLPSRRKVQSSAKGAATAFAKIFFEQVNV